MTTKFRPQSNMKLALMRTRVRTGRNDYYQPWQSRIEWYPVGWRLNKKTIGKQFGKLHYLACHAPSPIQKKWNQAYKVFYKKHFGSFNASVRYLNNWSSHNWL
jgi:hypothetical protein